MLKRGQFKYINLDRIGEVCFCISAGFNDNAKYPPGTAGGDFVKEKGPELREQVQQVMIEVGKHVMQWVAKESLFDTARYTLTDKELILTLGNLGKKMAAVIGWEQRVYTVAEAIGFFDGAVSTYENTTNPFNTVNLGGTVMKAFVHPNEARE